MPLEARERIDLLMAEGHAAAARRLDESARVACGNDFNNIIVEGPWDGADHDYRCPNCGVEGNYRAPFYDLGGSV